MASTTVTLSHVYRKATEELGMQQCKRVDLEAIVVFR